MKKTKHLFAFAILFITMSAFGQFRDRINISLFTGGSSAQQNGNNQGYWYGLYVDYMIIKTPMDWNFGLCAVAAQTGFKSNDTKNLYTGSNSNLGGGIAIGKYFEYLTYSHSAYFGSNLLLKSNQDIGEGQSLQANNTFGKYSMTQSDLILAGEVNINILKKAGVEGLEWQENLFPREQLRLTLQETLNSKKNSYWNNVPIAESALWNKASYGAEFKQSIYQFGKYDLLGDPKLVVGYNYFKGDKSNWWIIGAEIALKRRGWDDFLNVYFQMKQEFGIYTPNLNSTQFVLGLNFSPSNLIK